MCKLFVITGKLSKHTAESALYAVNKSFKSSQKDGFGFVARGTPTAKHPCWGRYLNPDRYAGFGCDLPGFLQGPISEQGDMPNQVTLLMVHGRTSTNNVTLNNVHPFRLGKQYLIHNGVLDWDGAPHDEPKAAGGCDSEQFFRWLVKGGTFAEAHTCWAGYGAIFVLDHKSGVLTLAKDNTANLYAAKRKMGGWVFSTSQLDINDVCKEANILLSSQPISVPSVVATLGDDGEFINDSAWKGFGERWGGSCGYSTSYDSRFARSMGHDSDYDYYGNSRVVAGKDKTYEAPVSTTSTTPKLDSTPHVNMVAGFKPSAVVQEAAVEAAKNALSRGTEKFPDYEPKTSPSDPSTEFLPDGMPS